MTGAAASAAAAPVKRAWRSRSRRRLMRLAALPALLVLLLLAAAIATTIGAAGIPLHRIAVATGLTHGDPSLIARDWLVAWLVRLPRIALAVIIGGLLAASGAVMQGLFRNPLADPALVGVSSGAGLAAASTIVVGDHYLAAAGVALPIEALPVAAFGGALIATLVLYRIATREGRTSIAMFLLGGLAIAALANAGLGLLVFLADDRQLRDINFWMLGLLSGATWAKVGAIAPFLVALAFVLPFIARGLDLLVLGEMEAFHAGVSVERLKRTCVVLVAAAAGGAGSVLGGVGFVGLVVPHLLRLLVGAGPRSVLPAAA